MTEGKFYRISVHVYGVKKRCRKADSHMFSLGYIPFNEGIFNQDEIEVKARSALAENMKTASTAAVVLNAVTVKDGIETWVMFGKENRRFELKTALEKELA